MMAFVRKIRYFLLFFLNLALAYTEQLIISDVPKVMDQIFKEHVSQKEMSTQLLQHGLKNYIEQFDPNHIYLIHTEVQPYLDPSLKKLQTLLNQYNNKDFSVFFNMNNTIKSSIVRAQKFRSDLEKYPMQLFYKAQKNLSNANFPGFAKNESELKWRIEQNMVKFIQDELQTKGEKETQKNLQKILASYEQERKIAEAAYLGLDEYGNEFSNNRKESLMAIKILKAFAASLDAHTRVYNPQEAIEMRSRLQKKYQGIGIQIQRVANNIVISGVIEGSPAEKNGLIKINDQLIEINSMPVSKLSLDRINEILSRDETPIVNLVLKRKNGSREQTIKVVLEKETITLNEGRVECSYVHFDNGIIGKIALHMFYQGDNGVSSANDVRKVIQNLKTRGKLLGLVLDLRDNNGGFLNQAVKVASLFIKSGVIVVSKYANGEEHVYRDFDGKEEYNGPLVVLTSRWTASAAEIVAQALQDYGVAIIVGDEQTYGKGTIQSQTITQGGISFFKVTVGKYYTVSGRTPQVNGVKADILVPSVFNDEQIGEEYLKDVIPPDTIPPLFNDNLADISPGLRLWYLQSYSAHLQHIKPTWRAMLPFLKRNSEARINKSSAYQSYLKKGKESGGSTPEFNLDDPQMEEAINIVADMILLGNGRKENGKVTY